MNLSVSDALDLALSPSDRSVVPFKSLALYWLHQSMWRHFKYVPSVF